MTHVRAHWSGRERQGCCMGTWEPPAEAREPRLERFDYAARPGQAALHDDRARFKVVVAHRRFGKTVFAAIELLRGAVEERAWAPRFAYVAPFYRQAKAIVWDYLKHFARTIEGVRFHETELRCDLPNGARCVRPCGGRTDHRQASAPDGRRAPRAPTGARTGTGERVGRDRRCRCGCRGARRSGRGGDRRRRRAEDRSAAAAARRLRSSRNRVVVPRGCRCFRKAAIPARRGGKA